VTNLRVGRVRLWDSLQSCLVAWSEYFFPSTCFDERTYSAKSGMIENRLFGHSYCVLVSDADTTSQRLRTTGCTIGFSGCTVFTANFNTGWDAVQTGRVAAGGHC
jgi:hypothetical protein